MSGCRKVCYSSKRYAKRARRRVGDGGLRAYRCPECEGCWHLGHLPRAVRLGAIGRDDYYGNHLK